MSVVNTKTSLASDIARILRGKPLMTGVALAVLQTKSAGAVSLGELKVQSALGQPLVATTVARIGPGESIASSCIKAPKTADGLGNPDDLKVSARTGNTPGNYPVQIRTTRPLYEPMYEIRLQIDCPGGVALAKSYVVMLNLPLATPAETAPDAVARPAATPATSQRPAQPQRSRASSGSNTRLASSRAPIPAGQDYRVRNGDTLSMIAQRVDGRPAGSTWQVAELLYRNNPHAFIRGNRDMIKLGAVLSVPDVATLGGAANPADGMDSVPAGGRDFVSDQPAFRNDVRPDVALGRPEETGADVPADVTSDRGAITDSEISAETQISDTQISDTQISDTQISDTQISDAQISNEELLREIRASQAERNANLETQAAETSPFVAETEPQVSQSAPAVAAPDNTANADNNSSNPLAAILAGIGMGAMLALLLLGRRLIAPLLEGRERRKAALAGAAVNASAVAAGQNADQDRGEKFATMQAGAAPVRPAYGGAGIDVELSDNAAAAAEASPAVFNPFTAADDAENADAAAEPGNTGETPRVSLRPASPAADLSNDFDDMLEDLEQTERFQSPVRNSGTEGSGQSPLVDADTGTMRNLFDDTASTSAGSDDETAEMPEGDAPTVEMPECDSPTVEMFGDDSTAELPEIDMAQSGNEDSVDIDITDLESLSRRLADSESDDRLSATLTQALDLLEQDYEEEFTQSQILEKQDVAAAFAEHKNKN